MASEFFEDLSTTEIVAGVAAIVVLGALTFATVRMCYPHEGESVGEDGKRKKKKRGRKKKKRGSGDGDLVSETSETGFSDYESSTTIDPYDSRRGLLNYENLLC